MRRLMFFVLLAGLVCSIGVAAAQPLSIEVATVESTLDKRTNEPVISLKMSEKSAQSFAQLTQENIGRLMQLRVDGKVIMSPVIREPILHGSLQITGGFSAKDTKDIVDAIKSSSKVEVELVSQ
jgi:preprotein translocase subunit SecD